MLWVMILLIGLSWAEENESHAIVRVHPRSSDHMDALRSMGTELGFETDFLRSIRSVDRTGDIVVTSTRLNKTREYLSKNSVPNWVMENNLYARRYRRGVIESLDPAMEMTRDIITSGYLSFDTQVRVLRQLAGTYPNLVRLEQIGNSTEGRPIITATVGYRANYTKSIFWIDAGIHAREWISHSVGLYTLWELVTNPIHTNLLRRIDVVLVNNVNPDGYEYTRNKDRLWRKTRSRNSGSGCAGVDGNRNYPFHWAEQGVSFNPCSEIYCGSSASSEPEVRALVEKITELKDRVRAYVALHSFGQDILYPWGHVVNQYPDDVEDLKSVANEMAAAIKKVAGTEYSVANSADGLYPASGASDDWAKNLGVKYSYTVELSPRDNYFGFQLPENQINQACQETFAGLLVLAKQVSQESAFHRRLSRLLMRG